MLLQDSEGLLVKRAVRQDREAFAALYDKHVVKVYRHVYYRVSSKYDAEDITQEVFIRAWKAIGKYRRTGAPFVAWLFVIARHLIADHYKARKKDPAPLDETQTYINNGDTSSEDSFDKDHVKNAILKLKGARQKVIMMRFIDGFNYGEIAKLLNKSEGAVRVIQHRALNDLREILKQSEQAAQ